MQFGAAFFEELTPRFDDVDNFGKRCFDEESKEKSNNVIFFPFGREKRAEFSYRHGNHVQKKLNQTGALSHGKFFGFIANSDGGKDSKRNGKGIKDNRSYR